MRRHVVEMTDTIAHRGPDDEGAWVDPLAGTALGSRRLAIIDLSPNGHQPIQSASGRYVIAYNGEIYNAASIARRLEAAGAEPQWRGHSDTEVILAAIEAWGVDRALEELKTSDGLAPRVECRFGGMGQDFQCRSPVEQVAMKSSSQSSTSWVYPGLIAGKGVMRGLR
jgi:Glutamine amidotransferase domain